MNRLFLWFPAVLLVGYLALAHFDSLLAAWWSKAKDQVLKEARWHWYSILQSDKIAAIKRDSRCSREDVRETFEDMVDKGTDPASAMEEIFRNRFMLE